MLDPSGDTRIGLGYGYWKARFSGDTIMAPGNNVNPLLPKTNVNGSRDGEVGWLVFIQGHWRTGMVELSVSRVDFSTASYKYAIQELNIMIGNHIQL